jgi:phosphopentomutase
MHLTVIVLDSVGVGALPDAAQFNQTPPRDGGDAGSHTLNHTLERTGVRLPNLEALGLGHIETVNAARVDAPTGSWGRMLEVSKGKDTSTGHWEFMGVQLEHPFQTFPNGFPPAVMDAFSAAIGLGWLCNAPYSGTDVIRDFGQQHLQTGFPIVYTSGDSVFQIAAHVDVVPFETLYAWCRAARALLNDTYATARVIARPFTGTHPFERMNQARKDFSLEPPPNVLDALHGTGLEVMLEVIGIGKIPDIYANRGFTREIHTDDNADGIKKTLEVMRANPHGLIFTNLVDFDAKYGHRRDPAGYARALQEFDAALPELMAATSPDGALILISDHGNDPTWFGTDHTREHGLLLVHAPGRAGAGLGTRATFSDVGATVCAAFGVNWDGPGQGFWQAITQRQQRSR